MKKSIFLFLAAILCAIGMNAATVTSDGTARLYFNMSTINWWVASNGDGNFGYFFNNSTGKNAWSAHSVKHDGNTYYVVIPEGTWAGVILTRNNTSTAPSWNNKWNQTGDITLSSTSNYISKFSEGSTSVTWGTAVKPASDASVSAASTIFVGASTTLTPSLTSNADINDIKSTTYTISPTTGASISGNTFTASAEGTYTITATVTYHPDGYSDTKLQSTATATTTIKAEVPAEETHDVTVSYICGSTKVADPTTVNTVGVETPVKVTAPEIAKYTFANWTLGADVTTEDALTNTAINITTKTGGSDFTLTANYEKAKLTYTVTVPAGTENCYMAGEMNGWDVDNPIELTKQSENVFTVTLEGVEKTQKYKYLSKKGTWDYAEDGGDRTWTANDVVTAWKDPLATNVFLAGEMNGWNTAANEFRKAAKDDTDASIILNLTTGTYKFKIVDNGSWLGNNGTIDKTISGWTFEDGKNDCPLKATIAGDYTFTWAISTKKLSVTYPTICAITATANDAAMGTIAGAGDYGKGSTATLTATPNDGYLFVNWTKGGEEVATTQEYSFTVTEAVELVANFEAAPEEVHNVTVSYKCGSNKIAEDQTVAAVGETSAKTVEAPAIFGYTFSSWTLGADVTSTNELTSNTIDINIVAGGSDYTLTANYTEIPKVTIYVVNNTKWDKVYAYGWGGSVGENPAWPGAEITANKEVEQIAGFDVHSYSVVPGSYVNIKFTNGSGTESNNFVWTNGKYYYMDAAANYAGGTREEVTAALITTYTVAGNTRSVFGAEWDVAKTENDMIDQGDGTYKWTKSEIALKKDTEIKFKVVKNHDWGKGSWPAEDWVINTIDKDGYYTITITFKESDKSINVTTTWTREAPFKDFTNQPEKLYLHPSFHWTSDNAQFAAYFYNEGFGADAEPKWQNMADTDGDGVYEVANAKQHEYVIFCRMNPERTENNWDENVKWNQISTGLTIPNTDGDLNSCCTFLENLMGDVDPSNCIWVIPNMITEGDNTTAIATVGTVNVEVTRQFTAGNLYTIALPFTLENVDDVFGNAAYEYTSLAKNGENVVLYFSKVNTIEAGKPYLIEPTKDVPGFIVEDVTLTSTLQPITFSEGGTGVTMEPVVSVGASATTAGKYWLAADRYLYNNDNTLKSLRALFTISSAGGIAPRVRVALDENGETALDNITTGETTVKAIINGQLIIIRDGEMYNAQGQRL